MNELTVFVLLQFFTWLGFVVALVIIVALGVFVVLYILGTVLQALDNRKKL